ncbi:TPA: type II secretion system F family protein, partial [Acinetobacter baumannii]|nr:type II secretion system F family protein [Acinetobacter baumannii]
TEFVKLKIKKAIKYPIAVLIAAIAVTAILMIKVIPVFEELFASFNTDLPAFTQLVIDISRLFRDYWFVGLVLTIFTIIFIRKRYRTNKGFRNSVQRSSLKIPIVGNVIKKSILARFSRTLATVYSAGIPIEDGLLSSAKATANIVYEEAINDVRQDVLSGQPIYVSLDNTGRFPNQVIQMVSIGESAGSLDEMLDRSAAYYEAEVDEAVDGLTSLLEPVMMAVLGVLIGALIIAMYLPIFMAGGAI